MFNRLPKEIVYEIFDFVTNKGLGSNNELASIKNLKNLALVNKQFHSIVNDRFWKKDPKSLKKLEQINNLGSVKSNALKELNQFDAEVKTKNAARFFTFLIDTNIGLQLEDLRKSIQAVNVDFRSTGNLLLSIGNGMEYAEKKKDKIYMQFLEKILKIVLDNYDQTSVDLLAKYISPDDKKILLKKMIEQKGRSNVLDGISAGFVMPYYVNGEKAKYLRFKK